MHYAWAADDTHIVLSDMPIPLLIIGILGPLPLFRQQKLAHLKLGIRNVALVHSCIANAPQSPEGDILAPPPLVGNLDILHVAVFHQDAIRRGPLGVRLGHEVSEENGRAVIVDELCYPFRLEFPIEGVFFCIIRFELC
jgi:hypothetical protein